MGALVDGVKFGREAFKKLIALGGSGGFPEVQPGEEVDDVEEVKQYIKDEAWGHHASCSCPIGGEGDKMAVLDGEFRVRGTEGLRVVDASVFPNIPGYFVAVPVYMVGEKAGDVIARSARGE